MSAPEPPSSDDASSDQSGRRRSPVSLIVSLALVCVIAAPLAFVIIHASRSAADQHALNEANALALRYIQTDISTPDAAVPLERGPVTHVDRLGPNLFTTKVAVEQQSCDAGECRPVCSLPNGSSLVRQISTTTAAVTWKTDGIPLQDNVPRGPVAVSTALAAAGADLSGLSGEIAVPIETPQGVPDRLHVVTLAVSARWIGAGTAPSAPADETTTASASDASAYGAGGCVVFTNLDPSAGYSYSVHVLSCAGTVPGAGPCTASPPTYHGDWQGRTPAPACADRSPAARFSGLKVASGLLTVSCPIVARAR